MYDLSLIKYIATAGLWVQIKTSLKKRKWATKAKEWQHTVARQKIYNKVF
jgi:hypothetical protein